MVLTYILTINVRTKDTILIAMLKSYYHDVSPINKVFQIQKFRRFSQLSPWRNRLARSAVNRKVGGSSPPGDVRLLQCSFEGKLFFLTKYFNLVK